jgi:hypothetical protein
LVTVPLIDAGEALALVRVADGHSGVVAAVSVDEFGNWRMSDSKTTPKTALETDAERARAALAGLVDRITADSVHVSNGGAA